MDDCLQKLKKWSVSCYTDRLLANQIAGKPVRITCHLIMKHTKIGSAKEILGVIVDKLTRSLYVDRELSLIGSLSNSWLTVAGFLSRAFDPASTTLSGQ